MVQLILVNIRVMGIISSCYIHQHIPFNISLYLMDKLFHQAKLYLKEIIYFQYILTLVIIFYKNKSINTIVSLKKIINGIVNVIRYDWNHVVPQCLMFISQNYYNTFSPLHIPMTEHDIILN